MCALFFALTCSAQTGVTHFVFKNEPAANPDAFLNVIVLEASLTDSLGQQLAAPLTEPDSEGNYVFNVNVNGTMPMPWLHLKINGMLRIGNNMTDEDGNQWVDAADADTDFTGWVVINKWKDASREILKSVLPNSNNVVDLSCIEIQPNNVMKADSVKTKQKVALSAICNTFKN